MACSPPGSSVHGILQARILEWVAIPFSRGSSPPRDWTRVSCIPGRFFITGATGEAPVEVKDAVKNPTRHRTVPTTKSCLPQNFNSAEVVLPRLLFFLDNPGPLYFQHFLYILWVKILSPPLAQKISMVQRLKDSAVEEEWKAWEYLDMHGPT